MTKKASKILRVRGIVLSPYARPGDVVEVSSEDPAAAHYIKNGVLEVTKDELDADEGDSGPEAGEQDTGGDNGG